MEINYLRISTPTCELYGGNQNIFVNEARGKRIKRCGCGLIAACDMTFFLKGATFVSLKEYVRFILDSSKYLGITTVFGISPKRIIKMLAEMNEGRSFFFMPKRKLTETTLRGIFEHSLSSGIPVIVRAGENFRKLPYKMNGTERKMRWHYFTVTGIDGNRLTFSSWGKKGEMLCSDLYRYFGVTGGIIITEQKHSA